MNASVSNLSKLRRILGALPAFFLFMPSAFAQVVDFKPAVDYPVGSFPVGLVAGDFDGDGIEDLVAANEGDNNLSILLGNGDGTFQTATTISAGDGSAGLAAADLNGGGTLDLVVGNLFDGNIGVFLGNGDGTFQAPVDYSTGSFSRSIFRSSVRERPRQ